MVMTGTQSAGTTVMLTDKNGNVIISHTADQDFSCVILSHASIKQGETYTLKAGTYEASVTMTYAVYSNGGGGMGGNHGGNMGGGKGGLK